VFVQIALILGQGVTGLPIDDGRGRARGYNIHPRVLVVGRDHFNVFAKQVRYAKDDLARNVGLVTKGLQHQNVHLECETRFIRGSVK
jgi:hypothetical protein